MKYPKDHAPQSTYAMLSMLHSQLGAAYSIIAQYEDDEQQRISERMRADLMERVTRPKADKEESCED